MIAAARSIVAGGVLAFAATAFAQDLMRHVDLSSPEMTSAEMTRAEVEAVLASGKSGVPVDLSGKKLSGLDLSGLDLSLVVLRAAKLNSTKLVGTRLDGAILDQAWLLEADLSGASLKRASCLVEQSGSCRSLQRNVQSSNIASSFRWNSPRQTLGQWRVIGLRIFAWRFAIEIAGKPPWDWQNFAFRMERGRLLTQEDDSWDRLARPSDAIRWYRWKSLCRLTAEPVTPPPSTKAPDNPAPVTRPEPQPAN
jgi:hypothetical protein